MFMPHYLPPSAMLMGIRDSLRKQPSLLDPADDGQANVLQFVHSANLCDAPILFYGVLTLLCEGGSLGQAKVPGIDQGHHCVQRQLDLVSCGLTVIKCSGSVHEWCSNSTVWCC
jgi:hypothetical protein